MVIRCKNTKKPRAGVPLSRLFAIFVDTVIPFFLESFFILYLTLHETPTSFVSSSLSPASPFGTPHDKSGLCRE